MRAQNQAPTGSPSTLTVLDTEHFSTATDYPQPYRTILIDLEETASSTNGTYNNFKVSIQTCAVITALTSCTSCLIILIITAFVIYFQQTHETTID